MSLLFDTSPQEPAKKRGRKPAAESPPPAVSVERLPLPADAPAPLGRLDDTVECLDEACQVRCHDIIEEDRGQWLLECCFCGTMQWAPVVRGHLPPPPEGGDFVFRGGRFAGHTIGETARLPHGMDYLAWAAKEHPRPAVKKACETYLASIEAAR